MSNSEDRRIDKDGLTVAWGDAARWKGRLREESLRAWQEKPLAERLRIALEMVRRQPPADALRNFSDDEFLARLKR